MRYWIIVFLTFVSLVVCSASVQAKEPDVFSKAKQLYKSGKYDATIQLIRAYLIKHGKEPSTQEIVPILLEALVRKDEALYFKQLVKIYYKKFPNSPFLPRIRYLEAIVAAKEKNYSGAVILFSQVQQSKASETLVRLSGENVSKICEKALNLQDFVSLRKKIAPETEIGELLAYYEILKVFDAGSISKAKSLSGSFVSQYPNSKFYQSVKKVQSYSEDSRQRKSEQIGLLAPLSGEYAEYGKYIVQAVQLAVENYNRTHVPQVDLVILDTKGIPVETAKKIREMIDVNKITTVVGPVLSAEATVAAAAIMDKPNIVMITPTATDEGIASLGKNIFQLNITPAVLAKRIATYSSENLRIKEFAILSPLNNYGLTMSSFFKEEIGRFGGRILAEEYFDDEAQDFRPQFENLRKKIADSRWLEMGLDTSIRSTNLSPRYRESYLSDSTIDIGGIFVPTADAEGAAKVAAQIYFFRLRTQILGSNGWHDQKTITEGKKYVENAIFSTGFELDQQYERWVTFSRQYKNRFKENPDIDAAPRAYDATELLLLAIADHNNEADAIASYLRKISGYRGVSGLISFNNSGVNAEAAIMKVGTKKFIPLQ